MKAFAAAATTAFFGVCALAACETTGGNDGISRFASTPYYGPGSPPREEPLDADAPEIPGLTDQDTLAGELEASGEWASERRRG